MTSESKMTKLLTATVAALIAVGSSSAFAAADKQPAKKAKVTAASCKKAGDKADAKMKAACAKLKSAQKKAA
jgi:hypothetical protein